MFYDRTVGSSRTTRQTSKTKVFPAPKKGWVRNEALASGDTFGAEVLDNGFPTAEGLRMRLGSIKRATCDAGVAISHLAAYETETVQKLFAADASAIYDVTPAGVSDPDAEISPDVSGLNGGYWSSVQFPAGGGVYLVMANGTDDVRNYNGSAWSTPTITGVSSDDLSFVWTFKKRLFFTEKGTTNAWYLASLSIAGSASKLDLGGIFPLGGSLIFGGTFSRDAGDGLDDFCIFATDQGEVAVYQGDDPSEANSWSLVGVYRIGKPLGKNAHFKAGGDIAVTVDDGIVSLAQAIQQDRAAQVPVTYPIEEPWRKLIKERSFVHPFQTIVWPRQSMAVVAVPSFGGVEKYCLVVNTKTGAWGRYTGWDTRCVAVFQDKLYFGTQDGTIVEGEAGGSDQGQPYSLVVIPKFDMLGSPNEKLALHARIVARSSDPLSVQLFGAADYVYSIPVPLPSDPDPGGNKWGSGVWGVSTWGGGDNSKIITEWQAIDGIGHALTVGLQVTSGRDAAPDFELVSLNLQYQEGAILV